MSAEIEALMQAAKPEHWTQFGLCRGDDRFTARIQDLAFMDWFEMDAKCGECPVFAECNKWASDPKVHDVFAAGYWRHGDGPAVGEQDE